MITSRYYLRKYPDPALLERASPVPVITTRLLNMVDAMVTIMRENNGIGLAAPQIGVSKRVITTEINPGKLKIMVNPIILAGSDRVKSVEGCLSLPGHVLEVMRYNKIKVSYMDLLGRERQMDLAGLEAFCVQHEIDHLNGKLILAEEYK